MRVLKMIITAQRNPGISEIALELSLAKSTTHGILAALEESGWVLRDPITRKYTCGHAAKDLAGIAQVRVPLVEKARPFLEKLGAELDEDVFLGILAGNHLLILDQVESSKELKITAKPGTRLSIYAGSAGKIFLAHMDPDTVKEIFKSSPPPRFTPLSITDPQRYVRDLELIRQEGVALDHGEYISNVQAVGVPIFYGKKNRKRMVAGFWLVGLDWHLYPGKMETTRKLALRTGEALSKALSNAYGSPQ
jgi:DNA-binding IclR family transcriptional regulator